MLRIVGAALGLAVLPAAAVAQTAIVDEVKIGVLANDIAVFGRHVEAGADVNFETLFTPPDFLKAIGSPRPDLGMTINSAGDTASPPLSNICRMPIWLRTMTG